jgi:hypothetical protein
MALWDHVADDEWNSTWSRDAAGETTLADRPLPSFLRNHINLPRSSNDNARSPLDGCPAYELDCLRHVFAPGLLRDAERRSREIGIGADQVLLHWGVIDEAAYIRRLSLHTGIEIEDLADVDRGECTFDDDGILSAATHGIIQFRAKGRLISAFAPRHLTARTICLLLERYPSVRPNLRLMTASTLQEFLTQRCGLLLADKAARGLTPQCRRRQAGEKVLTPGSACSAVVLSQLSHWCLHC